MSIITRMRKQVAVAWLQGTNPPNVNGQPVLTDAVQIACRWEDKCVEFIDRNGTRQVSSAVVYVDRVMQVGDLLCKAALVDITFPTGANARKNPNTSEVKGFAQLPNIKNTEVLLTAYL